MRLSLFILGVFSALICIEKPAEAQNEPFIADNSKAEVVPLSRPKGA
jgi:hypothetical protein